MMEIDKYYIGIVDGYETTIGSLYILLRGAGCISFPRARKDIGVPTGELLCDRPLELATAQERANGK